MQIATKITVWCQLPTSAIIGARTVAQLDDSLAALQAPTLDEEALEIIDAIAPAVLKNDAEG